MRSGVQFPVSLQSKSGSYEFYFIAAFLFECINEYKESFLGAIFPLLCDLRNDLSDSGIMHHFN